MSKRRSTPQERQAAFEAEVQDEIRAIRSQMRRKPNQPIERDAWRAHHAKQGNTATVQAMDSIRDEISEHNEKAGPGFIAQQRAKVFKDIEKQEHQKRKERGEREAARIAEEARAAGPTGMGGLAAAGEKGEPGTDTRFPTRNAKRFRKRTAIGPMSRGTDPGAPPGAKL